MTSEIRDLRQKTLADWCRECFGPDQLSVPQRGVRLLEEAIEAYQSAGGTIDMAHRLVSYVFAEPPGKLDQELGGLAVTLLALAEAAGLSAEDEEVREIGRILSLPPEHFRARNQRKNDAGFEVAPANKPVPIPDNGRGERCSHNFFPLECPYDFCGYRDTLTALQGLTDSLKPKAGAR